MLRQSGNILDIAKAICSRSKPYSCFVLAKHRVHFLCYGYVVLPTRTNQVWLSVHCAIPN